MNENNLMSLREFHPVADIFPMMSEREFRDLKTDIQSNGLLQPIWTYQQQIIDGRNRFKACQELGLNPAFNEYQGDEKDLTHFVISLNLHRRHLNESQRSMVAAKIANLRLGANQYDMGVEISTPISQSEAAEMLNVSRDVVIQAKAVQTQGSPELIASVEQGYTAVSTAAVIAKELPQEKQTELVARGEIEILQAAKQIREEKAAKRREELIEVRQREVKLPDGTYGTIVIDPPWPMEKVERDARPNQHAFEYPTMSEDEIIAFGDKVNAVAQNDCHMFMWTTQKFLPMSLRCLESWGFRYVLTMVWHKPGGFQPFGLPQYNCEFVVYARKGSPTFADTKAFNCCFNAPRREHSRKPDEFYELIERVTFPGRIDIFSREAREGYDQIGNEVDKFQEAA